METGFLILAGIICWLAWQRRELRAQIVTLRRALASADNAALAMRDEYRVFFAPLDMPVGQESWLAGANDETLSGEYRASQRLYNAFGRGYLN